MQIGLSRSYVSKLGNPLIRNVDSDIFTLAATPLPTDGSSCEACHYGVDIDVENVKRLMPHTEALKQSLGVSASKTAFYKKISNDADFPGGQFTPVTVDRGQCTFAARDGNGPKCGVDRYALQNGFEAAQLKPQVCSLYPATFAADNLLTYADDEPATSGTQSVYQAARKNIEELFGAGLVQELDEIAKSHPFTPAAEPVAKRIILIIPAA